MSSSSSLSLSMPLRISGISLSSVEGTSQNTLISSSEASSSGAAIVTRHKLEMATFKSRSCCSLIRILSRCKAVTTCVSAGIASSVRTAKAPQTPDALLTGVAFLAAFRSA